VSTEPVDVVTLAAALRGFDAYRRPGAGFAEILVLELYRLNGHLEICGVAKDANSVSDSQSASKSDTGDADMAKVMVDGPDRLLCHGHPPFRRRNGEANILMRRKRVSKDAGISRSRVALFLRSW
jgi:hypothetical protein